MPKSKRRPPHRKEKKPRIGQNITTPVTPTAGTSVQPVMPTTQSKPATTTGRSSITGAARHPFVAGELRRIGILTGIILVVLVILAFAIPRFM